MRKYILAFLCSTGLAATSQASTCFTDHLLEASEINSIRKPIYSRISRSQSFLLSLQSLFVSNLLISGEKILASTHSPRFDSRAEQLENEFGISVNCTVFVSMDDIGTMISRSNPRPYGKMYPLNAKRLESEFSTFIKIREVDILPELIEKIQRTIGNLSDPNFNCMARHSLESLLRITQYFDHYKELHSKTLFSDYMWDLIKLHTANFATLVKVDEFAEPVQKAGIPIICNDVPHVPEYEGN